MEALQVLEDIGGDLSTKPEPTDIQVDDSVILAFEHLQAREKHVQKLLDTYLLLNQVKDLEHLPKSLAAEVFTMIPPMVNINSRLTEHPSVHNKTYVLDAVKNWDKLEEIRSFLYQIRDEICSLKPTVDKLINTAAVFQELATLEIDRLDKVAPMVVDTATRKSYNLLSTDIETLLYIPDSNYNYPPYEGRLQKCISDVVCCLGNLARMTGRSQTDFIGQSQVTIYGIFKYVVSVADTYKNIDNQIKRALEDLETISIDKDRIASYKYIVEDALNFIKNTTIDKHMFNEDYGLASKILDLLKIIE